MREIKFRAWDKKEKIMIYDDESWSWFSDVYMPDPDEDYAILMQFTGLLDRLGKEIYEGDVVRYYDSTMMWLNREVIFDVGLFGLKIDSNTIPFYGSSKNEWEIVGNVYENPELLK